MRVRANGIEMNVESSGEGKCLVLIHGYTDNLNLWYNQVPAFSEHYRVVTYDVRGFGKTEVRDVTYSMSLSDTPFLLRRCHPSSAPSI